MSSCLYKLYSELEDVVIPAGYEVSFSFRQEGIGRTGCIKIRVTDIRSGKFTGWCVTPKELERARLDFIKDYIQSMIEELEETEEEVENK